MNLRLLPFLLASCGLFLLLPTAARADDDTQARPIFDKMLAAMDAKDYEGFVADANDTLRGALSQTQFEAVANMMAVKGKPEITFLGELNTHGFMIYLYRLRYADGDVLGTMSLKDGKVAGIFFK